MRSAVRLPLGCLLLVAACNDSALPYAPPPTDDALFTAAVDATNGIATVDAATLDLAGMGPASLGADAAADDLGHTAQWYCTDGVKDGAETDVDCGGYCSAGCAVGQGCRYDNDCQSLRCGAGICDAVRPDGASCVFDTDCNSRNCVARTCVSSCTDGVSDGAETDVDCGGGSCKPCGAGQLCVSTRDCLSGRCQYSGTVVTGNHMQSDIYRCE